MPGIFHGCPPWGAGREQPGGGDTHRRDRYTEMNKGKAGRSRDGTECSERTGQHKETGRGRDRLQGQVTDVESKLWQAVKD